MKIAIPSTTPDLTGQVEHRLGTASHLLVIETDDMTFETATAPPSSTGQGAGIQTVALFLGMGAQAILVGHVAPHIAAALRKRGIDVRTQISGPISQAVTDYMQGTRQSDSPHDVPPTSNDAPQPNEWATALRQGLRQCQSLLPILVGVILLLGLFRAFVPEQALLALFSGSPLRDALLGSALGGVLAGNPVNSYVIGKGLLDIGVGVSGATALMLAWVNVGMIQLPAESAALGLRFALARNAAGLALAVVMALFMAAVLGVGA